MLTILKNIFRPRTAISSALGSIPAKYQQAVAYHQSGQLALAYLIYEDILSIDPAHFNALYLAGLIAAQTNDMQRAKEFIGKAIDIQPHNAAFHLDLGNVLKELKELDAALASYDRAIALGENHGVAHYNKAIVSLLCGDFERGFELYEWRWKSERISKILGRRSFSQPTWLGNESLRGKTILLYCEQGFGDTIQFCRYAKLAADMGARVILEAQKPLLGLLASLEGVAQLVGNGDAPPAFDFQCPLHSLPLAFKTNIKTIPSSTRYLRSDASKVAQWQAKLGTKTKLRIGVVWSSTSQFNDDSKRSVTLHDFVRLLPENGFEIICLQKEIKETDEATLRSRSDVRFFGGELNDFSDTAALIECVDLVVSTCTSVPHLSCALGKPTWILLSYVPDWRWLLDRADSPWYPSARLYRQQRLGDWHGVFEQVKADLTKLAPSSGER